MIADKNAENENIFSAALCGHFATFAVKFLESNLPDINCRIYRFLK